MVLHGNQAYLKADQPLDRVPSQSDDLTDDSLSDLEEDNLSIFPPRLNLPLLPTASRPPYITRPSSFSPYTPRPSFGRVGKCRVPLRIFKMPALLVLFVLVMIGFMMVPWSGMSQTVTHDLFDMGNQTDPLAIHHLSAPDGSIHASFIGLGASIQSLMVKDRTGSFRDVVLGYDNTSQYLHDPAYPRFGSVVGRYANRIKNSTFTLPNHATFKVTPNEHGGLNTLHGGKPGWDRRPFSVEKKNLSYISFSIVDPSGEQGFPNQVDGRVEYELLTGARWRTRMVGLSDGQTPIMLSSHVYWNLDAYKSNHSAINHFVQMNAPQYIVTDGILIPTGEISSVVDTPLNFTKPRKIGSHLNLTAGLCGTGCTGYDNALVYDDKRSLNEPVMQMWSEDSGIKMVVTTDQKSVQIYTCNGIQPTDHQIHPIARKASHQGPSVFYENHSCVVIEQQSLIDGINNPHWGINQIYGPHEPYEWNSVYHFTTV